MERDDAGGGHSPTDQSPTDQSPPDHATTGLATTGHGGSDPSGLRGLIAGRFRLVQQVQRHPWGWVFRADDRVTDQTVCLRLLQPAATDAPGFEDRLREQVGVAACVDHDSVARVRGGGEDHRHFLVVEEWTEGPSLDEAVLLEGPLPAARVVEVATDLADALDAAHRAGVTHGNVAPSSVRLVGHTAGPARLGGFAVAPALAAGAPSCADDVQSLCTLVRDLLDAGDAASDSDGEAGATGAAEASAGVGAVPSRNRRTSPGDDGIAGVAGLDEAVREVLADPPDTAAELRSRLAALAGATPLAGPEPPPPARTPRWARAGLGLCSVLVFAGASLFAAGRLGLVTIAAGPAVEVPDVTGVPLNVALRRLHRAGLGDIQQTQQSVPVDKGSIVLQEPAAGSELREGDDVTLVVSTGAGDLLVPEVIGHTPDEAIAILTEAGLVPSIEYLAPTYRPGQPLVDPGIAFDQVPGAANQIERGDPVRVIVRPPVGMG